MQRNSGPPGWYRLDNSTNSDRRSLPCEQQYRKAECVWSLGNHPPPEHSAIRRPDRICSSPERTQHEELSQVRTPGIGSLALRQQQRPRRRMGLGTAETATPTAEAQRRSGSRSQSRSQWIRASRRYVDSCSSKTHQAVANNMKPHCGRTRRDKNHFLNDSLPWLSLFVSDSSLKRP